MEKMLNLIVAAMMVIALVGVSPALADDDTGALNKEIFEKRFKKA